MARTLVNFDLLHRLQKDPEKILYNYFCDNHYKIFSQDSNFIDLNYIKMNQQHFKFYQIYLPTWHENSYAFQM